MRRARDFRERIPDRGPMTLYRSTLAVAVAVCVVLAVTASAKEPRSASAKRPIHAPVFDQWSHERIVPRLH
jgi:hypothetical protein